MSKTALRLGVVALSAATVVGVASESALAAAPSGLSTVQAKAAAALALR